MGALGKFLRSVQGEKVAYWCPGCKHAHVLYVGDGPHPRWSFNGNAEKPTFQPSVHVRTGRAVDPTYEPQPDDPPEVCHSFVVDGRIQFLGDCTHALAGQTVDLPEKWVPGE